MINLVSTISYYLLKFFPGEELLRYYVYIYIYIYELRTKASHYRRMPILYGMQVEL